LERVIVSINFSLAPKAIQTRVKKVQGFVYDFSSAYDISPPLVFAIIHTESYFNPMAQSAANAYGLMQLVPTSGGADAYRSVYNSDGYPTPEFLFIQKNNVELGCAYVDLLLNRYLNDISNVLTRQYLAIAAYNTGVSNVYKAYDPNGSKSRAITQIESMTPQDNYEYLIQNLPYEETRDYLKKVVDRSILYESWSEN
jgi:membrane-bound lytic murein transglycosylase C